MSIRVITNHQQHIRDIENSLTREKNRLDYLKRCEKREVKWTAKKSDLIRDIGIQLGKITAYEDALEMALAYQNYDEREQGKKRNLRRYAVRHIVKNDKIYLDNRLYTVTSARSHKQSEDLFVLEFADNGTGGDQLFGVVLKKDDLIEVIEPAEHQQKVTF